MKHFCIITLFFIFYRYSDAVANNQTLSLYCNQTYFEENMVNKNKLLVDKMLVDLSITCPEKSCVNDHSNRIRPIYDYNPSTNQVSYGVQNLATSRDCWGYYLWLSDSNGKVLDYKYLIQPRDPIYVTNFTGIKGTRLTIAVCTLPKCNVVKSNWFATPENKCEELAWIAALDLWKEDISNDSVCGKPLGNNIKILVGKYCDNTKTFSDKTFREQVSYKHCEYKINSTQTEYLPTPPPTPLQLVLIASSVILVCCVAAALLLVWLRKSRKRSTFLENMPFQNDIEVDSTEPSSVLILHRPGCDLLDVFIRDLAFVLQAYNIQVKSSLLEQSVLDAEGGISSFMQRNISQCRYIIIAVTPTSEDKSLVLKHRPYEFALKLLGGLEFSGDNKATLVPIYFEEYNVAMKGLPSFLYPSMMNSFQLPDKLETLMERLSGGKKLEDDAVKDKKNLNFFTSKIKNQLEKILCDNHPNCIMGDCSKGKIIADELEVWPSETSSNPSTISIKPGNSLIITTI